MIACGGDALIDFVPSKTADGEEALVPRVGGSCLNVAVAMGRLGADVGFVGGVSTDMFGQMIVERLEGSGVKTDLLTRSDRDSTLAFVRMVGSDAQYAFFDEVSASRLWEYDGSRYPDFELFHAGSTTTIHEPSARAYEEMIADIRGRTVVSFDPNVRPTLVTDRKSYAERMDRVSRLCHIVRLSDEDFEYVYPDQSEEAVIESFFKDGVRLVLISRGPDGAEAIWPDGKATAAAAKVDVVDTIGAGDTFEGSFLFSLHRAGLMTPEALKSIPKDTVQEALAFAVKAAGINCTRAGCNPPTLVEMTG